MELMSILEIIFSIILLLYIFVPMFYKAKCNIKEKNWKPFLDLIISYIEQAEVYFDNGITRKEWVVKMVMTASKSLDYKIDEGELSTLIDNLCNMTKIVNVNQNSQK